VLAIIDLILFLLFAGTKDIVISSKNPRDIGSLLSIKATVLIFGNALLFAPLFKWFRSIIIKRFR
jgi:hypothetical protein